MLIRTLGLFLAVGALAAACSPAPGSPEWCKAAIEGKIKPTEAETQQHGLECVQHMIGGALGDIKPPGQ
jgi:hypothetical protein